MMQNQEKIKGKFDKKTRQRRFEKGDLLLLWNKIKELVNHGKFESIWLGPYKIHDIAGINYFFLIYLDAEKMPFPVNEKVLNNFYTGDI